MNLQELAKRFLGTEILPIAERLAKKNEIFASAQWREANNGFSHMYNYRVTNPTVENFGINEGITSSASETVKDQATLALMGSAAEIDIELLNMAPDKDQFVTDELFAHADEVAKQFALQFFYGTGSNQIDGICNRSAYSSVGDQVVSMDWTGASTSAYIVNWGEGAYLAHPKNTLAGVDVESLGKTVVSVGAKRNVVEYFTTKLRAQLVIPDVTHISRLANINPNMDAGTSLTSALLKAINRLNDDSNAVIYVNKNLAAIMEASNVIQVNVNYTPEEFGGKGPIGRFRNHPVHIVDYIYDTEAVVS